MRKVKKMRGWNIYYDDVRDTLIAYPPAGTIYAERAQLKTAGNMVTLIKQIKEVPNERLERQKRYYAKQSKEIDRKKRQLRKAKEEALRANPEIHRNAIRRRTIRASLDPECRNKMRCRDPC